MHLLARSRRRLIGVAAAACAAALVPVAALAATASVAAPAVAARTPGCATSGLVVWLNTNGNGYAGGAYYTLNFTNLSGRACTLYGYPGISAVSLRRQQLGSAAARNGPPGPVVRLGRGGTATVALQIVDAYNFGNPQQPCDPVTAAGLRIYPPNQFASKVVPFPFTACSRTGPVYLRTAAVQKG
jgi:Protein of unknown function (DUF4232)